MNLIQFFDAFSQELNYVFLRIFALSLFSNLKEQTAIDNKELLNKIFTKFK